MDRRDAVGEITAWSTINGRRTSRPIKSRALGHRRPSQSLWRSGLATNDRATTGKLHPATRLALEKVLARNGLTAGSTS